MPTTDTKAPTTLDEVVAAAERWQQEWNGERRASLLGDSLRDLWASVAVLAREIQQQGETIEDRGLSQDKLARLVESLKPEGKA